MDAETRQRIRQARSDKKRASLKTSGRIKPEFIVVPKEKAKANERTCLFCGKKFVGKSARQVYCSKKCKRREYSRQNRINGNRYYQQRKKITIEVACLYCGRIFTRPITAKAKYCCEAHRKQSMRDRIKLKSY